MAGTWLDNQLGRGEQLGELGNHPGGPAQVEASSKHQHGRPESRHRGAGGRRVKCPLGDEDVGRILVRLCVFGGGVGLGSGVPASVNERDDGAPIVFGSRTGVDSPEGGGRLGELRLALAKLHDPAPHVIVWLQANRPPARRDQDQLAHLPLMPCRVLHGDIGTG